MQAYIVNYYCINAVGKKRRKNEDNFFAGRCYRTSDIRDDMFTMGSLFCHSNDILAVYDGMGGESCGEEASLIAAENSLRFSSLFPNSNLSVSKIVVNFLRNLNDEICSFASENLINCMGTTAALLAVTESKLIAANLGDSRIYRIRNGRIKRISIDHLAKAPAKGKAPLSQFLGIPDDVFQICPAISELSYRNNDLFLICSDGVTDMLSDDEIRNIIVTSKSIKEAADSIYSAAMENGGTDNITAIVCSVNELPDKKEKAHAFKRIGNI